MSNKTVQSSKQTKAKFTPNMDNFKVSLSYEGLSLKNQTEHKSIADLKRLYAR